MIRSVLVTVAVSVSVGGVLAGTAAADPAGSPSRAAPIVHLVTGDAVALRPGGAVVLPSSTAHGAAATVTVGGRQLVLPGIARPYLGRFLDDRLFDVGRRSVNVPVRITAPAGTSVPGVTVTGRSGSSETGYVTPASAGEFGAALARQWERDSRPGAPAPTSLLGASRIALDAPSVPAAQPNYPQVTLILKGLGTDGKPATQYGGQVILLNTDDGRRYASDLLELGADGTTRVSVPLGHYSALAELPSFDDEGNFVDRLVPLSDATVSADLQTLTFDARTATITPTVTTPRPADTLAVTVEWVRIDARGSIPNSDGFSLTATPADASVLVAPAPAPQVGTMHDVTNWELTGRPATGLPYSYDLSFDETHGFPADQHHSVAASQLATVDSRYYTDGPTRASNYVRFPIYPFETFPVGFGHPLTTPLHRTEYVSGGGAEVWTGDLVLDDDDFAGIVVDGLHRYAAGDTSSVDWLRGPLAPGVRARTDADPAGFVAPISRRTGTLAVGLAPVADTTPDHYGLADGPTRFRLYRDGMQVADLADTTGGEFTVPAGTATYRYVFSHDRRPAGFLTSTQSTVDVSFVSSAATGGSLPTGFACGATGSGTCRIPAVLQVRVPLPETLTSRLPAGKVTVPFTVDHIQGAPASAITKAGLATSVDGKTWTAAPVTALGHGRFSAIVDNTTPGAAVSLRVTATDAAGGALTQTTTAAYVTAP